jgi:threonine/homoserine/homoserine lactone efflux protein
VPTLQTMLLFALAGVALIAIPGPNMFYILLRGASQGTRAGVASALGVETGTLVHIFAASVGVSAIIAASSIAFDVVKYAGAAYLVYLGIRTLVSGPESLEAGAAAPLSLRRLYTSGILVNVLNPKVALFFLALLPQFVDPRRGPAGLQMVVLGLILLVIGICFDLIYAVSAGALGGVLARRPKIMQRQKYVTGPLYIGLGAVAALTGSRSH